MIYYTSDLHLFHKNIIKLCNRPYDSVEQMNADLVERWNRKVTPEDDVYILGDIVFAYKDIAEVKSVLSMLNGRKHLIKGNHDKFLKQICWQDYFVSLDLYAEITDSGRTVCLFHYPIEEWNGFYRDSYMLHGHVHGIIKNLTLHERKFDVGVDTNNFEPVTLNELIERRKV